MDNISDSVDVNGANVVVVVDVAAAVAFTILQAQSGNSANSGYTTAPQLFILNIKFTYY